VQDFIFLLGMAHSLKHVYFWNFPCNIFRVQEIEIVEREILAKGSGVLQVCLDRWKQEVL
jgi:hypothetical protein